MRGRGLVVVGAGALVCLLLAVGCSGGGNGASSEGGELGPGSGDWYIVEPASLDPPPWSEWVLRHWVWEDESTQESATALVEGYLECDIPVGAVIIDRPWATGCNTFEFDTELYPQPQEMIDHFHELGVRVFLWATSMIDVDTPIYDYACERGYFLNNCKVQEWWAGEGSFIDYTNPEALEWWHSIMDKALDMGIDGWKVDGTDAYVYLWLEGIHAYAGNITPREYQEMVYRDFFYYTRERLGNDRAITSRPFDSYGYPLGLLFAPRDVCHAGWVGDQDPTFEGLRAAMFNMFKSAEYGYVNFGSDIGGYRGGGLRDKELFIRWAQFGAFSPIMENGGNGEHRPWMYDDETLDIYRDFTLIHHSLIPYLYSQGAFSYASEIPLLRPYETGGVKWQYYLGDALFVAPFYEAGGTRKVHLPEGMWYDFFTGDVYVGGTTFDYAAPLERYPVFVKAGEILVISPVQDSVYGSGEDSYLVVCYPADGDTFEFYRENSNGAIIGYVREGTGWEFSISATEHLFALQLRDVDKPSYVESQPDGLIDERGSLDELRDADSGWYYDDSGRRLWIKLASFDR
ncbi:MAG TPA: hypothetical protein ENF73_05120, partial [Proteobacteria bacterium]|nr:hypothetical protein [Pseudomonadota bacterium]